LSDPQFWVVTAAAFVAIALLVWRLRRAARSGPELPCANCPQGGAHRRGAGRPARLPLVAFAVLLAGPPPADAADVERVGATTGASLEREVAIAD
jgi:hypothetical protein